MPELEQFCGDRGLKMGCIADLVEYRRRRERMIERDHIDQVGNACDRDFAADGNLDGGTVRHGSSP